LARRTRGRILNIDGYAPLKVVALVAPDVTTADEQSDFVRVRGKVMPQWLGFF